MFERKETLGEIFGPGNNMGDTKHDLPSEALVALQRGSKIDAIKCVRTASGVSLKEAKEIVEDFIERSPDVKSRMDAANAESAAGAFRWLLLIAAIAFAIYYFLGGSQ